jgi:hypothetical protein
VGLPADETSAQCKLDVSLDPPLDRDNFQITADLNESKNLRNDPSYLALWEKLTGMLEDRASTGPPLTSAFPLGEKNKTTETESCNIANRTGYLFPSDY